MSFIHPLETRVLFAADPIFEMTGRGTLVVHGTDDSDVILVDAMHGNPLAGIIVTVTPESVTGLVHSYRIPFRSVKRFRIEGGDGGDTIDYRLGDSVYRPVTILGQAGNDTLAFFSSGPTLADGGDGDDFIGNTTQATFDIDSRPNRKNIDRFIANDSPHAINTLLGGDGDDTLAGDSNDSIDAGNGNDTGMIDINAEVSAVSQTRANAIAHDYYARIGAAGLETAIGNVPIVE
jgi:hypothetical protein